MQIQDNHDNQRKIYIRNTKQWVPVTEEVYSEYYRPIWRLQKEAQKNGQCVCPKSKLWGCDGDCATCEYRAAGNTVSLNGQAATWEIGENILTVTVTSGSVTKTYTITVTKS